MFDTYVDNLVRTFNQATGDQIKRGLDWYPRATRLAEDVARLTGTTRDSIAGVIAALSPRCTWEFQERFTLGYVEHYLMNGDPLAAPHPGTNTNKRKAGRILDGLDPLDVLGGEKVRAFYLNISKRNNNVPTLDIWAVRAALGEPTMNTARYMHLTRGKKRVDMVAAYMTAADECGIRVDNFQAICWVAYREMVMASKGADDDAE
jgi:hypothetical protein